MAHSKPPSNRTRKISLPSPSHPLLVCLEQNLQNLKSSKCASLSVFQQLNGLNSLYESFNDALHLPLSQLDFSKQCRSKCREHVLDGSIELLDMCGEVRDCFSQFRERVKELESSIRRRRSREKFGHDDHEVDETCMKSKKILHKMVRKCLKNMKRAKKNYCCRVHEDVSDNSSLNGSLMINLFKGVQEISFAILGSCLSFIISQGKVESKSKLRGWCLVSNFLQERKVVSFEGNEEMEGNEVLRIGHKKFNPIHVENMLRELKVLELNIEEVEKELEVIFRLLLKTRVSMLNMFNY